ncbi:MAG: pilus assembly protein FimV, partial [Candidatus Puniceispirillaceae bacterium]
IRKNRSAFVRGNPNYLYADKLLHLPSLNEIRAMIIKQPASDTTIEAGGDNRDHIFFFGG